MHCSSIWSLTHSSVIRKHSAISASLAFNVFSFITCSVVFPYCSILMHFAILAKQVSAFRHTLSSNTCWASFQNFCLNFLCEWWRQQLVHIFMPLEGSTRRFLDSAWIFFFCYVWIWSFEFYFCSWFFACTALFCFLQGATDSRHSNASVTTPILHRKNSKFLKSSFKTVSVGTIILAAES